MYHRTTIWVKARRDIVKQATNGGKHYQIYKVSNLKLREAATVLGSRSKDEELKAIYNYYTENFWNLVSEVEKDLKSSIEV